VDIEAIIDGIKDAGMQEIASIEQNANSQVQAIREKATVEANKQKSRIVKDTTVRLNRSQAVIEQRAYMQSLQLHADARQKLMQEVIQSAKQHLKDIRSTTAYKNILEKFIQDSIRAITPSLLMHQKMILHVDKKDEDMLTTIDIPDNEQVVIQYDIECKGGCEIESDDGMVRVLNTFESRFKHALPQIEQQLSVFFEEKISSS